MSGRGNVGVAKGLVLLAIIARRGGRPSASAFLAWELVMFLVFFDCLIYNFSLLFYSLV